MSERDDEREDEDPRPFTLQLTREQRQQLRQLRTSPAVGAGCWTADGFKVEAADAASIDDVLRYLVSSICDGIRRPGSWERGVVQQLFGDWIHMPAPLCRHCAFDLLDEDLPIEMETKHCTSCLLDLVDEFSETLEIDDPKFALCQQALAGDESMLRALWNSFPCKLAHTDDEVQEMHATKMRGPQQLVDALQAQADRS